MPRNPGPVNESLYKLLISLYNNMFKKIKGIIILRYHFCFNSGFFSVVFSGYFSYSLNPNTQQRDIA